MYNKKKRLLSKYRALVSIRLSKKFFLAIVNHEIKKMHQMDKFYSQDLDPIKIKKQNKKYNNNKKQTKKPNKQKTSVQNILQTIIRK